MNSGQPQDFISMALEYEKQKTAPKGDNCHVVRGGKRGPNARPVFPACDGYAPKDALDAGRFPFKVEACATRTWAAYSHGWTQGTLIGQTGVLFRPSRMAGDDYVITVYLAYDKTGANDVALDTRDEPLVAANALQKGTGKFQVWREVHVVRYILKNNAVETLTLDQPRVHYRKAYIELKENWEQYTLAQHQAANQTALDYNQICREVLQQTADTLFTGWYAVDPNADHAQSGSVFLFLDYVLLVRNLYAITSQISPADAIADLRAAGNNVKKNLTDTARALGLQADLGAWAKGNQLLQGRLATTQSWLVKNKVPTEVHYCNRLNTIAPFRAVVNRLQTISGGRNGAAANGITILQFDYLHNVVKTLYNNQDVALTIKNGTAVTATDGNRNRCVLVLFRPRIDTFVHEIGHHLFLPHTGDLQGGRSDRHDCIDDQCFMSYKELRNAFCGLCQLRLRGWDATQLGNDSYSNQKF